MHIFWNTNTRFYNKKGIQLQNTVILLILILNISEIYEQINHFQVQIKIISTNIYKTGT
jgi:hypothetical protein